MVDLLKSKDEAQDEKSIRCIAAILRISLEANVKNCMNINGQI